MSGLLDGKVAIVTGGAKGLGLGISRRLVREGAKIVITGREGAAAEAEAARIREELGGEAIGFAADVGVKADVEAMVERTVAHFGGLDILVNNAATLTPNILLENKTDDMLRRTLDIALWGSWWSMQAAFPHFRARGGGSVVNLSMAAQKSATVAVQNQASWTARRGAPGGRSPQGGPLRGRRRFWG